MTAADDPQKSDPQEYADPGVKDQTFQQLVREVNRILNGSGSDKADRCTHLINVFIVSRLMVLREFNLRVLQQTSNEVNGKLLWLAFQLSMAMHIVAMSLFNKLKKRHPDTIVEMRNQIEEESEFFYALDEAQTAYRISAESGLWKSTDENNQEKRGIGCPILRELTGREKSIVVAGTALSLGAAESCQSDLGKLRKVNLFSDFPLVGNVDEVTRKLKHALNVNDVELGDVQNLGKLVGRGRLLGGVYAALQTVVLDNPLCGKSWCLQQAIDMQYGSMLRRLEGRIVKHFLVKDVLKGPVLVESMKDLAIAALWGTEVSIAANRIDVDLLDIGLCPLKEGTNSGYMLNEELAREAILNVSSRHGAFFTIFATTVSYSNGTAAGEAAEPLFVTCLMKKCRKDSVTTVKSFLEELFGSSTVQAANLPDWIATCNFVVARSFSRRTYSTSGIKSDVDFIQTALNGTVTQRNILLSPSNVKRPEFEGVMDGGFGTLWFLSISCKLYPQGFDDENESDLISTKPSKFYCQKDGEKNQQCKNLRASWESLLNSEVGIFSRCLRIHFCLSDVKRKNGAKERLFVDPQDGSIVAYITKANAQNFLDGQVYNMMNQYRYLGN